MMLKRIPSIVCLALLGMLALGACGDGEDGSGGAGGQGAAGGSGGIGGSGGTDGTGGSGGTYGTGGSGGMDGAGGSGGAGEEPTEHQACSDEVDLFTPCGGDLIGTWALSDVCLEENIDVETCPEFSGGVTASYSSGFTISFSASEITFPAATRTLELQASMPLSCADELEEGVETCADLSGPESGECSGETVCTCEMRQDQEVLAGTSSYTKEGEGAISIDGRDYDYCVDGDLLFLMGEMLGEGESDTLLYILRRQ